MKNKKNKIGVGHPTMGRGGSEARAMWCLEALKDDFDVSLITTGTVDLDELNRFYGTSLHTDQFHIRKAPLPFIIDRINGGDALRGAYYQRFCRKIASDFDVLISTYNICDFGVPAIQCIADFSWIDEIRKSFDPPPSGTRGLFHKNKILRKIYLGLSRIVSNPSGRNIFKGEDLILANSRWSAKMIKQKYSAGVEVLYPPVITDFPKIPPRNKKSGFVCIGRISPEKRIEQIIEIIRTVRRRGHDVHLHIIGGMDHTPYCKSIENLYKTDGSWVFFEGKRLGNDKKTLLSQHLFGIHARSAEPFGISVAEMVKAGCITFVPDEGGQAEIVNNPMLIYNSIDDAVNKIDEIIKNEKKQVKIREHLSNQGNRFSTDKFMAGIKSIVEKFSQTKLA